ncbi:MAG TPA: MinD/ParA family protein [Streptosporangiaceae bacterium]|nr:MinD/ParA family protein [Streptosporangiaceae bacterium]
MTTNNDTPQASREAAGGPEWMPDWAGQADDYPQPSFYPPRRGYPRGPGFAAIPPDLPDPAQAGYPAGSGSAPDAHDEYDLDDGQEPGFGQEPGYVPGYPADAAYPWDGGYPDGGGYPNGGGYPDGAGAVPPLEPLPPRAEPEYPEGPGGLAPGVLLPGGRPAPGPGWRRGVYRLTGGLLRFGGPAAELRHRDLVHRARTPVAGGHHRIAVLSLKGGVGKTTTAVGLGATLATLRGDRVIAVDANPDRGTLSDKVRLETAATVRDLLNERDQIRHYGDMRGFTSQAPSRLEVLASDRDPAVSVAFGAEDYWDAACLLERFYSICITDCGTGLLHSAMSSVLQLGDQVIVVSSPSVDGARSASATLDWLEAHSCADLVRNGIVVLSAIRPKSKSTVDLDRLEHHFAARCRAVVRIPYDAHLEEGAEVELELLGRDTADAYLELAALVGDGLACPRRAALPWRVRVRHTWLRAPAVRSCAVRPARARPRRVLAPGASSGTR